MVTNQAAIDSWYHKDVTIRNYILASMEQSQKQNLYGMSSASDMWLKIISLYASRPEDIEHQYIQEMYDYKYDAGNLRNVYCHIAVEPSIMILYRKGYQKPHQWHLKHC